MSLKKSFFLLACVVASLTANAQSIGYYPFNSVLSVSTNPVNRVWADARFQTNSYFSALSLEVAPFINVNNNSKALIYVGPGVTMNFISLFEGQSGKPIEGYFLATGVRSSLFDKYPGLQVTFELSPYVFASGTSGQFKTRLGIAYNLSQKKLPK